jgi:hypothetical protein
MQKRIKYPYRVLSVAFSGACAAVNVVSFIISTFVEAYFRIFPPKEPTMKDLTAIIPFVTFFVVLLFTLLIMAPYLIYRKQQQKIKDLLKALKTKEAKSVIINTDAEYIAELLKIKNEVEAILKIVGDRLDELLLDKAARFLILRTIQIKKDAKFSILKANVDEGAFGSAIQNIKDFVMWLKFTSHGPSVEEIGEYCITLFLVYDSYVPKKWIYSHIVDKALQIIGEHFSRPLSYKMPLCEEIKYGRPPQFEDILKDYDNPPQNKTEIIGRLREYLNRVNIYLEKEGLFEEEDI